MIKKLDLNQKAGFFSSIAVILAVFLFAIGLIINYSTLSYFVCLFLSWAYLVMSCSYMISAKAERKIMALCGVVFAIIYCVLIDIVYFTQLTVVANVDLSSEVKNILSYESLGSLMFVINLFGYGMMAISTFFIGLSFTSDNKADNWLNKLLIIHGVFAISCILLPMLNVFKPDMPNGELIGRLVLLFWCIYFMPISILSALRFFRNKSI